MALTYFTFLIKPLHLKVFTNVLARQHTTKTITGDTILHLGNETLLGRIMSYLNTKMNNQSKQDSTDNTSIVNNLLHEKCSSLRTLNVDQLTHVFHSLNTNIIAHTKQNRIKLLNILDVECCLRVNSMDSESIIKVLNAYMHIIPNRITEYKFYQYATDNIDRCLNEASLKELLQFIFYIGLQKDSKKAQMLLKKCLRRIDKNMLNYLSVEDLCIICNSMYRTHTKITNKKLLEKVKETLSNNLYLLKDTALLITLIKTIKHNRCQEDDILSTIKCTIFFNRTAQYYTFPAMCHILSLYADNLYYEEDLLKLFSEKCIDILKNTEDLKKKNTYLVEQFRTKDITRFLWILSILGFSDIKAETFKNIIVPHIQRRIEAGQYINHPEELTNSMLYLRMLNYPAKELVGVALSKEHISGIKDTQSKRRLNLLLTVIKYEDEELSKSLNIEPPEFTSYNQNSQIQLRPELQRVYKALNCISHDLEIDTFELQMQISHLKVVGISAFKNGTNNVKKKLVAYIEVLDESNCVKNKESWPSGYMKLKLNILELFPVPLITISKCDIEGLTEEELQEYLKEEFQLIVY